MPTCYGFIPIEFKVDFDDQWESRGSREYTVGFSRDTTAVLARNYIIGIYYNNKPDPDDPNLRVIRVEVDGGMEPTYWVDATLEDPTTDSNYGQPCYLYHTIISYGPWNPLEHTPTGNPVDQPPNVTFDWQVFEEPADFAINPDTGDLVQVVNSAGDPFDPTVVREQLKGIMRVTFNSLDYNPFALMANGNYINSDTWNNFPPFTVKFTPPKADAEAYSQYLNKGYWRLSCEFGFQLKHGIGWNADTIDAGFRSLIGGVPIKIVDPLGQPLGTPSLLDGSGNALTIGGTFYQFNFQLYQSTSFNAAFALSGLNNLFN